MATRMSTPRRSASTCGCMPTPPKIVADCTPQMAAVRADALVNLRRELAGRREHQRARRLRLRRHGAAETYMRSSRGSANAAVLPVPVCAPARRSRPSSATGIAAAWIGVRFGIAVIGKRAQQRGRKPECFQKSFSGTPSWKVRTRTCGVPIVIDRNRPGAFPGNRAAGEMAMSDRPDGRTIPGLARRSRAVQDDARSR